MGKQATYSEEFKEKTVSLFLQSNLSAAQLAKTLGIHPNTVCNWIRQYSNDSAKPLQTLKDLEVLSQQIEISDDTLNFNIVFRTLLEIEKQLKLLNQTIISLAENRLKK